VAPVQYTVWLCAFQPLDFRFTGLRFPCSGTICAYEIDEHHLPPKPGVALIRLAEIAYGRRFGCVARYESETPLRNGLDETGIVHCAVSPCAGKIVAIIQATDGGLFVRRPVWVAAGLRIDLDEPKASVREDALDGRE
jgi:hypothetical protein